MVHDGGMAFLIVLLMLVASIALAPWLGRETRRLDPNHFEPTHPLSRDSGANCG